MTLHRPYTQQFQDGFLDLTFREKLQKQNESCPFELCSEIKMEDVLSPSNDCYSSATPSVSKSISKFDITNLENKIKVLEKQIIHIKDKKKIY